MSVLTLDPIVYSRVNDKLQSYPLRKEVDINYCSTFYHYTESQITELVKTWARLNYLSYAYRYKEGYTDITDFISVRTKSPKINTCQLLKYLHCIDYNIEPETIRAILPDSDKEALNVLKKGIDEIESRIIHELPEYKEAYWSEF